MDKVNILIILLIILNIAGSLYLSFKYKHSKITPTPPLPPSTVTTRPPLRPSTFTTLPPMPIIYCPSQAGDVYGWGKLVSLYDWSEGFLDGRNYDIKSDGLGGNQIKTLIFDKENILLDGIPYMAYIDNFCDYISKGILISYDKQKVYGFSLPLAGKYTNILDSFNWIYIYDIDMNNSTKISDIKNYIGSADDMVNNGIKTGLNFIFITQPHPNSYFEYNKK